MRLSHVSIALILVANVLSAQSMYMVMQEGSPRCLSVEVPVNTSIVAEFSCALLTNELGNLLGSSKPLEVRIHAFIF